MRDFARRWLAVALFVLPCSVAATPAPSSSAAWLALLHADQDGHSRIDSAGFFISAEGARDPQAEWQATLDGFRDDPALACRYPARWQLMRAHEPQLADLPPDVCADYARWRERLGARGVTLVLASAYLGNPSSTFGHTFLRLDADGSPLLAWAVNFAAQTQDQPGPSYAIKGLAGGYTGRFSLGPYYDKVAEYAYLEQRNLWEYPLKLDAAALDRLLAHLWELQHAGFDYFFLDENCSFQLLALIQASRPELPLTRGFDLFAAPVDTIRRLQAHGLIDAVAYRPALRDTLEGRLQQLDAEQQAAVQAILKSPGAVLPEQPRVLDVVADLARYRSAVGVLGRRPDAARKARWLALEEQALSTRSGLQQASGWLPAPAPPAPDQSHLSQRLGAGGLALDGVSQLVLDWRPALHDLLDGAYGLAADSEIAILDTQLSVRSGTWRLQRLSLIDVRSLPPRDAWFSPWSWQVAAGYRRDLADGQGLWRLAGGLGLSRTLGVSASLLGQAAAVLGEGGQRGLEYGAELVLRERWHANAPWQISVQHTRRVGRIVGDGDDRTWLRVGQHWQINPRWGLRVQFAHEHRSRRDVLEAQLMRYF